MPNTNHAAFDWDARKAGALALLLFAGAAFAQGAPEHAGPARISYADGQLTINALNATLEEILTQVAAVAGVKIDVPANASKERMGVVELGPGSPREILASLLQDCKVDYLIQGADRDPERIQSVMVMLREKGGTATALAEVDPRGPRGALQRPGMPAPEATQPPTETAAVDPALNPQPPGQPELPVPSPAAAAAADQSNLPRPGTMAPPQNMTSQNITQQLQQMYQQRMQMVQQGQLPPAAAPAGSGGK